MGYSGNPNRADLARQRVADTRYLLLEKYGGEPPSCARCGFADVRALTLDHVNGGGSAERKALGNGAPFYRRLLREPRRRDLQVLCMNCQWIKRAERGEVRGSGARRAAQRPGGPDPAVVGSILGPVARGEPKLGS